MKALITGASSGLGKDFAFKLSNMGYDLILVSRNKKELNEVASNLKTNVQIETYDLSNEENCIKLFDKHKKIDLLKEQDMLYTVIQRGFKGDTEIY